MNLADWDSHIDADLAATESTRPRWNDQQITYFCAVSYECGRLDERHRIAAGIAELDRVWVEQAKVTEEQRIANRKDTFTPRPRPGFDWQRHDHTVLRAAGIWAKPTLDNVAWPTVTTPGTATARPPEQPYRDWRHFASTCTPAEWAACWPLLADSTRRGIADLNPHQRQRRAA